MTYVTYMNSSHSCEPPQESAEHSAGHPEITQRSVWKLTSGDNAAKWSDFRRKQNFDFWGGKKGKQKMSALLCLHRLVGSRATSGEGLAVPVPGEGPMAPVLVNGWWSQS